MSYHCFAVLPYWGGFLENPQQSSGHSDRSDLTGFGQFYELFERNISKLSAASQLRLRPHVQHWQLIRWPIDLLEYCYSCTKAYTAFKRPARSRFYWCISLLHAWVGWQIIKFFGLPWFPHHEAPPKPCRLYWDRLSRTPPALALSKRSPIHQSPLFYPQHVV